MLQVLLTGCVKTHFTHLVCRLLLFLLSLSLLFYWDSGIECDFCKRPQMMGDSDSISHYQVYTSHSKLFFHDQSVQNNYK